METIKLATLGKLDAAGACANSQKGLRLAIKFTSDRAVYAAERAAAPKNYLMDDYATWALGFLTKSCSPPQIAPLVEELIIAEKAIAKKSEPTLALSYLSAADFYRERARDNTRAEQYYKAAMERIPFVSYQPTHSYLPEKFDVSLAPYEQMLASAPGKDEGYKKVHIMRIQQQAKHLNNAGNNYLSGVFEPPKPNGTRWYETNQAVEAFTKAIDLIPLWSEPYRGRAKAYELLGKSDLAAKDLAKAKSLE